MKLENSWNEVLKEELNFPLFKEIETFLEEEREKFEIYPPQEFVFTAFPRLPMIR